MTTEDRCIKKKKKKKKKRKGDPPPDPPGSDGCRDPGQAGECEKFPLGEIEG